MKTFSARETAWLQELDGIELAGFWRRAIAFCIDWMIVLILISITATLGTLAYIGIAKALGHPTGFHINFGHGNIESKLDQVDKAGSVSPILQPSPTQQPASPPAPAPPSATPASTAKPASPARGGHIHFERRHVDWSEVAGEVLNILFDVVVPCLYFGLFFWRWNGRTPGKRLMKIRVLSLVHKRMTFWHSVERALGYGAAALEGGFGFIQYWIHPYRRCAQDRLAETIVVTERGYQARHTRISRSPPTPAKPISAGHRW